MATNQDFFRQIRDKAKKIADDSGLTTKEGREEIARKAREFAKKTKDTVQQTARQSADFAQKTVEETVHKAQAKGEDLKSTIRKKTAPRRPKPKADFVDAEVQKPAESTSSKPKKKKTSIKGAALIATGLAVGGAGVGIGIGVDDADTHCAFFSLEEEYYLMKACIKSCKGNASRCSERIKAFECREKAEYEDVYNFVSSTCPLNYR